MVEASTLTARYEPGSARAEPTTSFTYNAAPGEANNLSVSRSPQLLREVNTFGLARIVIGAVSFREGGGLITSAPLLEPPGVPSLGGIGALCGAPLLPVVLCLTQADWVFVTANLGDRNDRFDASTWTLGPFARDGVGVDGGAGNDTITTGPAGDFVGGGIGDDSIVLAMDGMRDIVNCGAGNDVVTRSGGIDANDIINPDCEVVN